MSKKLDSILSKYPSATVSKDLDSAETVLEKPKAMIKLEGNERIVAVIPAYLKQEIKQYLVYHPEDTERTVILKALKAMGFNVRLDELEDKRGRKKVNL